VTTPPRPWPGLFISFEGIDGSGKSTQARQLHESLRAEGHDPLLTREPGGSPGAEEIRALVLQGDPDRWSAETELLLFTAARRDHMERVILPALQAGRTVICDRFADSTRMYQGRGGLRDKVDALHDLMIGVEPDLTLLIDMPAEVGLFRSMLRIVEDRIDNFKVRLGLEPSLLAAFAGGKVTKKEIDEVQHIFDRLTEFLTVEGAEDRYEAFGVSLQKQMRDGFLSLAHEYHYRFRVIDGNRGEEEVAAEVRATIAPHLPVLT
jgi:dTMP kinase